MIVSSRSHTNTLWRGEKKRHKNFSETLHPNVYVYIYKWSDIGDGLYQILFCSILRHQWDETIKIKENTKGISIDMMEHSFKSIWSVDFFWSFTSRSLSGGGEGLFLRPLPRDLEPPLRQARSSNSLIGVEGLCTVSKSPEKVCKHTQEI